MLILLNVEWRGLSNTFDGDVCFLFLEDVRTLKMTYSILKNFNLKAQSI
jgi:hypothetical protein